MKDIRIAASAMTLAVVTACSQSAGQTGSFVPATTQVESLNALNAIGGGDHRISHVFVIVQENRTVDNLFNGFPGADTVRSGVWQGRHIALRAEPIATSDHSHVLGAFLKDTGCVLGHDSCPMNGFDPPANGGPGAYAYVDSAYTKPYFAMAEQYAFGDNMFPSNLDASFVSHQYLIAAQANRAVNFTQPKASCQFHVVPHVATITDQRTLGPKEAACFDYKTIVDELAAHSLSWRYYMAPKPGGIAWWNPFNWIPHDASAPGGEIVASPSQFINDIGSRTKPYDAAVTWVTPTSANSDHAGVTKNSGPSWVAAVVNAIGKSKYWDSSVIFITWDDWGGWYDHVSPPFKGYDGLGIRVPFIIISPYTKRGLVTHRLYEQASILKYIETRFGLSTLSDADARAADPEPDVMSNGNAPPRAFQPIPAGPFTQPDDANPPDDDQ